MKKLLLIVAMAFAIVSCNKQVEVKEYKTAYVDTSKLLEEYTKAKDIQAKYKAKSTEMSGELQSEIERFKAEAQRFPQDAKEYGQLWAQKKGAELQKKEQQLSYAQQALVQQLQQESGKEMDSLVSDVKKYIKDYGKQKKYDYIYATGEAVSILYAQEKYDITKEIIKLLNERYAKESSTEPKSEAIEEETK